MASALTLHHFSFKAMGSPCQIKLYAHNVIDAANAFQQAAEVIHSMEQKYSRYIPGNFLDQINQRAEQGGSATIDAEFFSILEFADTCYNQSNGLFDITSGVLRKAWDFSQKDPQPNTVIIDDIKESIGWHHIEFDEKHINFKNKGMQLDFGGIVKEYATDRAAYICQTLGIQHGIVDMGGDIHVFGPHPDGSPWAINVRDPQGKHQGIATIQLHKGAVASSGNYERFIVIEGKRYSHILSPKTGWPVSGISSATVISQNCIVAGGLSTICMLKEKEGIEWLCNNDVDAIITDDEYQVTTNQRANLCHINVHT